MRIDLVGKKSGRLTVLELTGKHNGKYKYLCVCECGNTTIVFSKNLTRTKSTESCGCIGIERLTTHKMTGTRQYKIYKNIKSRCFNPKVTQYQDYGGRGITMCKEWRDSFENFWEDMKDGYSDKLSIDRIDNDKGYYKENCRWSTKEEQNYNKRNNAVLTLGGESRKINEWSEVLGISKSLIRSRRAKGWSDEVVLTMPIHGRMREHVQ